SAEMIRLPGHSAPRFGPVNTTAQTMPSRFTTVPHSWFPNPPFAPLPSLTALVNAAFNLLWSGTFEQSCGFCANTAAGNTTEKHTSNLDANAETVILISSLISWQRVQVRCDVTAVLFSYAHLGHCRVRFDVM